MTYMEKEMLDTYEQRIADILGVTEWNSAALRHVIDEIFEKGMNEGGTITGEAAKKFVEMMENPKPDPERERIVREAIEEFPNPGKPTVINVELREPRENDMKSSKHDLRCPKCHDQPTLKTSCKRCGGAGRVNGYTEKEWKKLELENEGYL